MKEGFPDSADCLAVEMKLDECKVHHAGMQHATDIGVAEPVRSSPYINTVTLQYRKDPCELTAQCSMQQHSFDQHVHASYIAAFAT